MSAPRTVDYDAAAVVALAALDAGESVHEALMGWSGKPRTTVTNWVTYMRAAGMIPPPVRGAGRRGGRRPLDPQVVEQRRADRAAAREQARLARAAEREQAARARADAVARQRAERKAARALQRADRLSAKGVQVVVVHTWAPREGAVPAPPVDRTPGKLPAGVERVLACDDCEFEAPIGRPIELIRHTVGVHHRQPTREERTPGRVPGRVS